MSRKLKWRFAFQITEGVNAGLGAGSWRVWATGSDLYVAAADLAGTVKASLHASGKWRVGYTSEHMSGGAPLWDPKHDRAVFALTPPPFVDGVQEAFVIATWRNALRPAAPGPSEVIVPIRDAWDVLTGVKIWITEPDTPCPAGDALVMPAPLKLSSGRNVWLSAFADRTAPASPEPVPVGQLVEVWTPQANDVACPGFLVRGLNVG